MRDPGGRRGPEASGRAREDAPGVARTRGRPCQVAAVLVLVLVLGGSTGARRCWGFGLCHGAPAGEESVDAIREPRPASQNHLYKIDYVDSNGEKLGRGEYFRAGLFREALERRPWWSETNSSSYEFFYAPTCFDGGFGTAADILGNSTKDFIVVNRFDRKSVLKTVSSKVPVAERIGKYIEKTGKRLSWWPETFIFNKDKPKTSKKQLFRLQSAFLRYSEEEEDNMECNGLQGKMWLAKGNKHGASKIEVFNEYEHLESYVKDKVDEDLLVQKYIEKPLLISGSKFDLRMYVLVTSEPKVYLYRQGEVKVSATQYSRDTLQRGMHITNYKLQKEEESYDKSTHMLSTDDLEELIGRSDFLWSEMFEKISAVVKEYFVDIMLDKLIEREPTKGSFYLYGLDIMFDEDLNAYLLEANFCPGMCYKRNCLDFLDTMIENMFEEMVQKVLDPVFPPPANISMEYIPPQTLDGFVQVGQEAASTGRTSIPWAYIFKSEL